MALDQGKESSGRPIRDLHHERFSGAPFNPTEYPVAIDSSTSVELSFTELRLVNLDHLARSSDLDRMVKKVLHTNIAMEVVPPIHNGIKGMLGLPHGIAQ